MSGDVYFSFGADTGKLEAAMASAKAEVRALGRELAATAREMQESSAKMDSELGRSLTQTAQKMAEAKSHMSELRAEMRAAGEDGAGGFKGLLEGLTAPLESLEALKGSLAGFAELVAGAFVVEQIADWVKETAEAAEQIERLGAMLGLTTDQVQRFTTTVTLSGGDADQTALQMERLQLKLAQVGSASNPAAAALKALSINAEEFRRLDMQGQLEALAEAFSRFEDGPTKTAVAMELLGRAGAQMIPYLNRGKEGMAELGKTASDTGVIMRAEDVKAMAEVAEASKALGLAIKALGQDIAIDLIVPVKFAIDFLTKFVEELDLALKLLREFHALHVESGNLELLAPGGVEKFPLPDVGAGADPSWGRNVTVHGKPQVPQMDLGRHGGGGSAKAARDEAGAEREGIEEEIQLTERATAAKLKSYDDELAHKRISIQTWLSESEAALNKELADVKSMYDKEAAVAGQTATQIAKIKKQEAVELAKINDQIVADQRKAVDDLQKQWEGMANSILGPFNTALKGIITGHETMRAAATKALDGIAEAAVKAVEKTIVSWASGLAAKKALDGTAVAGDAGRAAAGAYAATAEIPIVGPLIAPAAAGAAFAATEAFASFDIGAWKLPSDQLAMVHKNELVMPAGQAEAFRSMLSGMAGKGNVSNRGGDTHNWNIHSNASDPREVAREVARQWDAQPSLRPHF